jgi:hypothetical protein
VTRTQRQIEGHRKANAVVTVRDAGGRPVAGIPVWVEQESHEFCFGCVVPPLDALPESDRSRYRARLEEVFNRIEPAERPPPADGIRFDVPDAIHLGALRVRLERLALASRPVDVHLCGRSLGLARRTERDGADRLAQAYTLCFAHSAVRAIFWHGLWAGEEGVEGGLLRQDFSPTPAFRYLQKLIDVVWHTRAGGVTDAEGRFAFRGFRGFYRAGVLAGEQVQLARFSLRRQAGDTAMPLVVVIPDPAGR